MWLPHENVNPDDVLGLPGDHGRHGSSVHKWFKSSSTAVMQQFESFMFHIDSVKSLAGRPAPQTSTRLQSTSLVLGGLPTEYYPRNIHHRAVALL